MPSVVKEFFPNGNSDNSTISLKNIVAKKARTLLMGNGYSLVGANENTEEFFKSLGFFNFLNDLEYQLSKDGKAFIIMDVDRNGEPRLTVGDAINVSSNNSYYVVDGAGKVLGATITRYVSYGTFNFKIMEQWGQHSKKVIINNAMNTNQSYSVSEFNELVPERLRVFDWDYSNLNSPPIMLVGNHASLGSHNSKPDGYNVEYLQKELDQLLLQFHKEIKTNITRFGINASDEKLYQTILEQGLDNAIGDVVFIYDEDQRGSDDVPFESIKVIEGNPKTQLYLDAIKTIIQNYIEHSGYSNPADSDASKTTVGTLFTKTNDFETTRAKKIIRESQLDTFLTIMDDVIRHYTNYDIDFNFKIRLHPNIVFDENTKLEFIRTGLELGLLTRKNAIKMFNGLNDEEDVDLVLEELKEEQNEMLADQVDTIDEGGDVDEPTKLQ